MGTFLTSVTSQSYFILLQTVSVEQKNEPSWKPQDPPWIFYASINSNPNFTNSTLS